MEEDIKSKWNEGLLKITTLDVAALRAKFEKDYPGLSHKVIKNFNDKIYKKDE